MSPPFRFLRVTNRVATLVNRSLKEKVRIRPFVVMVQYQYWGLYWVFNFVTTQKHFVVCSICRRGVEAAAGALSPRFRVAPIPFMRRYGLAALMGAVFGLPLIIGVVGALLGTGQ